MNRSSVLVLLFLSFLALPVHAADPLPRARPEAVGLSPERLERIGQVLRPDIERGRLPGAVVAIARKGRLAYYESFGYLDKQAGTPMPKDAIFGIASMTKPMVDTGFVVPPAQVKRYARALPNDPDTGKPQQFADRTKADKFECGGGCAVSMVADYVRFGQMLLNRGRLGDTQILASRTVDYMTANHLGPGVQNHVEAADPTKAGYEFGLTMAVSPSTGGPTMMGSPGAFTWSGATGTDFCADPREQLVVVVIAAAPGPIRWHYRRLMNALVYQSIID